MKWSPATFPFRLSWVHLDFAIATRFSVGSVGAHIVIGTAAVVKSLMKAPPTHPTVAHYCEGKTNTKPSPAPNKYHKYTNAKDLLKSESLVREKPTEKAGGTRVTLNR